MNSQRIEKTLNEINEFGASNKGMNRLAYTKVEQEALNYLASLCEKEGMKVRMDAAGNLIARREGKNPELPVVAFGSHIDTVYEAGRYDGTVGVVAALEVIRSLNDQGIETEHPLEIISFACEESARFNFATLGSKAMAGVLSKEEIFDLKDRNGLFLRDELSKCSLNIDTIEEAKRSRDEFKVFLELHVEQGPVLEKDKIQIGIATGIAAPTRYKLDIIGQAAHSGSTPMDYRKDAFMGAAEIAIALESAAITEAVHGTVATVGVCAAYPGAMNVVPGNAGMKIDIRGISVESKGKVIEALMQSIRDIAEKRDLKIQTDRISEDYPVEMNADVISSLVETCKQKEIDFMMMPSGAGHDSMNMARLCPTGLFFIPSKDGVSHNPNEFTSLNQIVIGVQLLEAEVLKWAGIVS